MQGSNLNQFILSVLLPPQILIHNNEMVLYRSHMCWLIIIPWFEAQDLTTQLFRLRIRTRS